MFNRNTTRFAIVLVVLISAVGIGAAGAAAQMDDPILVDDEKIDPTNETESIYVDVTGVDDFDGATEADVDVTIEGLAEGETSGNGTIVDSATLSVTEGATESYDYSLTDADRDYDQIVVTAEVVTDGDESLIASVDWGTLERVGGGAGGGLGGLGSVGGIPILLVVGIVGAYVVFVRD